MKSYSEERRQLFALPADANNFKDVSEWREKEVLP